MKWPRLPGTQLPLSIYQLSLCTAFTFTSASLLITISALIGFELAPDKRLATLPLALQFFSIMCASVPASLFMGRFGRKAGFLLASVIGITGASLALWSVFNDVFIGFCLATICFGSFTAFANYYRFTAAEVVDDSLKSQAIAMVMAGGVVAAFIGPNMANWSAHWFSDHQFAGPFAVLIVVYTLSMLTIMFTRLPPAPVRETHYTGRPLAEIMAQPLFIGAVLCQMFGYGTMNLVMTSTPLAMQAESFGLAETSLVIQWHVVAMFAPSFFTGHLIRRLGIVAVLCGGVVFGLGSIAINLTGQALWHFVSALALLGMSWNFLYVGGTTLLTDTYTPAEKSRTQAVNDLLVFSMVSLTALSAGGLHYVFGWRFVNLAALPMLFITGAAVAWLFWRKRATPVFNV